MIRWVSPRYNADGSRDPCVSRGDWYRARGPRSSIVLKFYTAPPNVGGDQICGGRVRPNSFLGPVHQICNADPELVAVLVPVPWEPTLLGWLNVWGNRDGGADYALRLCDEELDDWRRGGWVNQFID